MRRSIFTVLLTGLLMATNLAVLSKTAAALPVTLERVTQSIPLGTTELGDDFLTSEYGFNRSGNHVAFWTMRYEVSADGEDELTFKDLYRYQVSDGAVQTVIDDIERMNYIVPYISDNGGRISTQAFYRDENFQGHQVGTTVSAATGEEVIHIDLLSSSQSVGRNMFIKQYLETPILSANGTVITYVEETNHIIPGEPYQYFESEAVKRYDIATSTTVTVAERVVDPDVGDFLSVYDISADGQYILYYDGGLKRFDLETGTSQFVARMFTEPKQAFGYPRQGKMSADGRFVVFEAQDKNANRTVAFRDMTRRGVRFLCVANESDDSVEQCDSPSVSDDGTRVVFRSYPSPFTPDDHVKIMLRDTTAGNLVQLNKGFDGEEPNSFYNTYPIIDGSGEKVVFGSRATNLLPDESNEGVTHLYLTTVGRK